MNPLRNLNLKGIIKFAFALLTIFFVSCGGDDYTPVIGGDKDNTTDNNGGGNNTGGGNEGGGSNNTGGELSVLIPMPMWLLPTRLCCA